MYSYVPAFDTVTGADAPGAIGPVVHEPSRAAIVRTLVVVFLKTMSAPARIFTRGVEMPSSLRHSSLRPAVTTL